MEIKEPKRLKQEPDDAGWAAADVQPEEYVDDEWVQENTKEVTDGVDESTDSSGS